MGDWLLKLTVGNAFALYRLDKRAFVHVGCNLSSSLGAKCLLVSGVAVLKGGSTVTK